MGRVTRRTLAHHLDLSDPGALRITSRPDTVTVEEPLEIRVAGVSLAVTMRTPGNDFDLAIGFLLPHGPRDERAFDTSTGKAQFLIQPVEMLEVPPGRLLMQTIRSHDQFNTTIYGHDDRYRGIHGTRKVVLVNPTDLDRMGFYDGDVVTVVSEFEGQERRAEGFRLQTYPTALGCAAAYYPETNVLLAADHVARRSNTPVAKSLVVRFERA